MPKHGQGQPAPAEDESPVATKTALVVAANVRALMDRDEELNSNLKLGGKTKLGHSAISRILHGQNITLKSLEALGRVFELEPWQLLVPIVDPKNPPALKVFTEAEKAFYAKIDEAEKALKALKEGA